MNPTGQDYNSPSKAAETFRKFQAFAGPTNIFRVPDASNQGAGSTQSLFPVQLGSVDPEDLKYGLRATQVGAGGIVPGQGMAVADDAFFNYMERKREMATLYEFQNFVLRQADLSTPEKSAWWYEHFPWMKQLRMQYIDRQADIQRTLAHIAVTGPQTDDDFMLIFLQQKGMLGALREPLYNLNAAPIAGPAANYMGRANSGQFIPGMYSLFSRANEILVNPGGANPLGPVDWTNPIGVPQPAGVARWHPPGNAAADYFAGFPANADALRPA